MTPSRREIKCMNNSVLPKRKHPRLKGYDYSSNGSYFITVCTVDRKCVLGHISSRKSIESVPAVVLNDAGKTAKKYIDGISAVYPDVILENYIVMPNHIHMLITLCDNPDGKKSDISQIIKAYKRLTSKEIGYQIWQESFYDEIIKDDLHFQNVWEYIEYNACKWEDDKYFLP